MERTAVVVGALGVIGRYIVERLLAAGDWSVIGLSRRSEPEGPRYQHISVDLTDPADATRKLAGLTNVTHIFYAAFQASTGNASGYAANIKPNVDMLANAVSAIDRVAPGLRRVVLVTGTKYYGVHLGPVKTPMRESDPRHLPPNYYFDQIDWLASHQKRRTWDVVELRPQTLCGFAPGTPMSLLPALAVYAAVSKELGQPLKFPGKPGAFATLYQVTESSHFADAALWAATEPRAANQAYNITNGDLFRWKYLWPTIAEVFEMPVGDVQTVKLAEHMPALAPVWERIVARYGLKSIPFDQLAAWPFADYVFGADWDVVSDVTKCRRDGFHAVVDSTDMFRRLLIRFRRERIVP